MSKKISYVNQVLCENEDILASLAYEHVVEPWNASYQAEQGMMEVDSPAIEDGKP